MSNKKEIDIYRSLKKSDIIKFKKTPSFKFTFDYSPRVDTVAHKGSDECVIRFIDKNDGSCLYEGKTSGGLFTSLFRRWFTPWKIECFQNDEKIYDFDFEQSLFNQEIYVSVDSSSLGDTLAWMPVIYKLKEKYKCDLYVSSFWNELLSLFYKDVKFLWPGIKNVKSKAIFGVGWYEENDRNRHKRDPRSISLQQVSGDILGINVDGDFLFPSVPDEIARSNRTIDGKYVCLAMDSTANAKHWHYPGGWQSVVDYLNSIGYKVVVIQKQGTSLENIIDKTGDHNIITRAIDIYHADFLIGIGSGLSWLSWALHKPTIMISGFSKPECEFSTKNYRIINTNVCNGCFNDTEHLFDRGDWDWCPRLKDTPRRFECSKSITPDMVFTKIQNLISNEGLK